MQAFSFGLYAFSFTSRLQAGNKKAAAGNSRNG
jgi:hypothetical protein